MVLSLTRVQSSSDLEVFVKTKRCAFRTCETYGLVIVFVKTKRCAFRSFLFEGNLSSPVPFFVVLSLMVTGLQKWCVLKSCLHDVCEFVPYYLTSLLLINISMIVRSQTTFEDKATHFIVINVDKLANYKRCSVSSIKRYTYFPCGVHFNVEKYIVYAYTILFLFFAG